MRSSRCRFLAKKGGAVMLRGLAVSCALLAALAAGCVSQARYDREVEELTARIGAANAKASGYSERIRTFQEANEDLQLRLDDAAATEKQLAEDLAAVTKEAADLRSQYESLGGDLLDELRAVPGVQVGRGGAVQATVSFALGGAEVAAAGTAEIRTLARALAEKEGLVYVDGHSDNSPVGSVETRRKYTDNLGLSMARAAAVARVLTDTGIPAERLVVRGWGSLRPIESNDAAAGRAKNRRVEICFVPAEPEAAPAPGDEEPEEAEEPDEEPVEPVVGPVEPAEAEE